MFLPKVATGIVTRPLDPANRLSTIAHLGLQLGIAAFERDRLLDIDRTPPFKPEGLGFADRVTVAADDRFLAAAVRPGRRGCARTPATA